MRAGMLLIALAALSTEVRADPKPGEGTKAGAGDSKKTEEAPQVPPQCLRDINPTGRYELKLTSVPSTEIPIKQCSGAPTGTTLVFAYEVDADPASDHIQVKHLGNPDAIIRDPQLQRSVTNFCKSKGAKTPVVTWFSWDEYVPLKKGWSMTYKGFGSGDSSASIGQRLSLIGMMMDDHNMPICYMNWSSE